jgi:chromosome partitioning protein
MRKIICIANQKGGVGKTTTAINLSATLAAAERKTLLIDCDSQGNATSGMGIGRDTISGKNLYHALIGKIPLKDVIVSTQIPHLDMAPANQDLIGIEKGKKNFAVSFIGWKRHMISSLLIARRRSGF